MIGDTTQNEEFAIKTAICQVLLHLSVTVLLMGFIEWNLEFLIISIAMICRCTEIMHGLPATRKGINLMPRAPVWLSCGIRSATTIRLPGT